MRRINIFRERFLNRNLLIAFFLTIILFGAFVFFLNLSLEGLYKNELKRYANIIGATESIYKDDEKMMNILLGEEQNEEYIESGLEKLREYGYTEEKGIQDKWVGESFKELRGRLIFPAIFLFLGIFITFLFVIEGVLRKIKKVSEALRDLSEGKDYEKLQDREEGEISLLYHRFNLAASRLESKISETEDERNGVKELLSDLSHQLKTPIASLKMNHELILDGYVSEDEEKEFFKNNCENIEKMEWITEGLLKLSRLEAQFISLNIKESNLKDTLIKSINSTLGKANSKNIRFNIGDIEDSYFSHDEKWTGEAVGNILENAIKYSNENGIINISLKNLEWKSEIEIEDFGYGIDPVDKENIFKRFYRGKGNEIQGIEGSGIGLYLSKKIIEEQSGTIKVSSKVGEGSKFTITLYKHILT